MPEEKEKPAQKTGRVLKRRKPRKHPGIRKIYLLPNLLTTGNIVCGCLSILYTLGGRYQAAAYAIVAGWLFDLLDGRVARLTKTGSIFGVNYDSLSDLVTFGVAPTALIFQFFQRPGDKFLAAIVLIYTVSCALRLARFNIHASTSDKEGFKGLPTPASALTVATLFLWALLQKPELVSPKSDFTIIGIEVLALVLSGLMVSDIPYPSIGVRIFKRRHPFPYLVFIVIAIAMVFANPPLTLFVGCVIYVLSGPVKLLLDRRQPSPEPEQKESQEASVSNE